MSRARIERVGPGPVKAVTLKLQDPFSFQAGQYLTVDIHGEPLALSIASAPHRLPQLHLLYQSDPDDALARAFDQLLQPGGYLNLSGPFGAITITATHAPELALIAGGTGAAQALAIIDELTANRPAAATGPAVTFLWCAAAADRFVRPWNTPEPAWLEQHQIIDPTLGPDNAGLQWLQRNLTRLRSRRFLICGSPGFVYAVTDVLGSAGIPARQMDADAYVYAPRD